MRTRWWVALGTGTLAGLAAALARGIPQEPTARPQETTTLPDAQIPRGPVARDQCTTCHAPVKQHRFVHGPVTVDACDACHKVVDEARHTYALVRTGAEQCTFCHEMNVKGSAIVHEPLVTGDCTACHNPHGSEDRMMLHAASCAWPCGRGRVQRLPRGPRVAPSQPPAGAGARAVHELPRRDQGAARHAAHHPRAGGPGLPGVP
jgi:predicted CXXCH cytochrome family protein